MRKIDKGPEPKSWTLYRHTPGADYDAANKDDLREALIAEQGGLCAYCQSRIVFQRGQTTDTRIEHIKCRNLHPDLQLDYKNMVLCCNGITDGEEHCDVSKHAQNISFTPFDKQFINTLTYSSHDGTIKSSNPTYNAELNGVLNLNHAQLKANRREALLAVITMLPRNNKWKAHDIQAQINRFAARNAQGQFVPYNGIVLWFMRRVQTKTHK